MKCGVAVAISEQEPQSGFNYISIFFNFLCFVAYLTLYGISNSVNNNHLRFNLLQFIICISLKFNPLSLLFNYLRNLSYITQVSEVLEVLHYQWTPIWQLLIYSSLPIPFFIVRPVFFPPLSIGVEKIDAIWLSISIFFINRYLHVN